MNNNKIHPQQYQQQPYYQQQPIQGQPVYQQPFQQQNQYHQYPNNNIQNQQPQQQQIYIHELHGQEIMQKQKNVQQQQQQYNYNNNQQQNYKKNKQQNNYNQKNGSLYSRLVNTDLSGTIFEDKKVRKAFIGKVLSIIASQLLLSTLLCLAAIFDETYKVFLFKNYWLYILCWVVSFGCCIVLYCNRTAAKESPKNYILLLIFTLAESYTLSYHCAFTSPYIVLQACGILTLLVTTLTIYATQTDNDITQKANFFFYGMFAVIALVIVGVIYPSHTLHLIISLVIIFFFSAYLVFDIQRLQGNKKMAYSIDDYIIASLDIYLDIIIIFKQLLYVLS